ALLGPDAAAAREDPCRPDVAVVGTRAHDGGVAVGGQRDRITPLGGYSRSGADQLVALLRKISNRPLRGSKQAGTQRDRYCKQPRHAPARPGGRRTPRCNTAGG